MDRDSIGRAILMAEEFITRATKCLEHDANDEHFYWNGKDTGALRRQSMELTRALAEMRKP